jgi:ABC-type Fe3+/spermidine/putrescine transport system ATPase subunit
MDEPLGALDRLIKLQIQREISELVHRVEVTTIYVTHDQREALTMADRVAVMHDGRLQQIGTPTDLVRTPASRFVAEFLGGAGNYLDAIVENFDQIKQLATVETAIGRLVVRAPGSTIPGGKVSVHVRPEDVELNRDPRGSGVVASAVYTGEIGELAVQLDDGSTLTVKTLGIPGVEAGTRVRAVAAPGVGLILDR